MCRDSGLKPYIKYTYHIGSPISRSSPPPSCSTHVEGRPGRSGHMHDVRQTEDRHTVPDYKYATCSYIFKVGHLLFTGKAMGVHCIVWVTGGWALWWTLNPRPSDYQSDSHSCSLRVWLDCFSTCIARMMMPLTKDYWDSSSHGLLVVKDGVFADKDHLSAIMNPWL